MKNRIGLYTHKLYSLEDVENGKANECCKIIRSEVLNDEEKLRDFIEMQPEHSEPISPCYMCYGCPKSRGEC